MVRLLHVSIVMVVRTCSLPSTIWPKVRFCVVPAIISDFRSPLIVKVTLEPLWFSSAVVQDDVWCKTTNGIGILGLISTSVTMKP